MKDEDINKKFECLIRKGVFKPVARFITNDTEERMEEGIAQTFELYRQHALRGVELDIPVLVCVCRRRATDLSRHLVRGQHSRNDPLDPRAFCQGRVELVGLDGLPREEGELSADGNPDLEATVFERERANTTSMISAISLGEWLEKLTSKDLVLITLRLQGYTLTEIATEIGRSVTVTCQRLQQLGQDLANHAQLPVPKRSRKPRRSTMPLHLAMA